MTRAQDLVLFGATGFTGRLTARYLADNGPAGRRWAIAGRNLDALSALRDELSPGNRPELLVANVDDPDSLRRLAESTRVVATTVGPYLRYGEPLVAACATAGTDYLDLTGEPEFVDRVYLAHHATAQRSGARLIHACGFDSIPYDLGAQYTVAQLPADQPISMRGYVTVKGALSGGTFESAVTSFSRSRQASRAHAQRRRVEGREGTRRARAVAGRPGYDAAIARWVLPMPTVDPQIVARSARALDEYGPDFSYSQFLTVRNPIVGVGLAATVAGMYGLAQFGPTRRVLDRLRPTGPDAEKRARNWFRITFIARSGDNRVRTEVRGGDPGYGETAKMLGESALCLAYDKLPTTAGQVTTAVAMGGTLRDRLDRAGITFRVIDS